MVSNGPSIRGDDKPASSWELPSVAFLYPVARVLLVNLSPIFLQPQPRYIPIPLGNLVVVVVVE